MIYALSIDGRPLTWKRPRSTRHGGVMYNPSATAQAAFADSCSIQFPDAPLEGPLRLELYFIFARPLTHFDGGGRLLPNAPVFYTEIADIDNLIKFTLDAMNGTVYVDDSQVLQLYAIKRYDDAIHARTTVIVETL